MMRLDKLISQTGLTRSEAKKAISSGRVQVRDVTVRDTGMNVLPEDVLIDGEPIEDEQDLYIMINKPAGVLTATEDKFAPTVMSLLPEKYARRKIGPVGRLDKDVTGLVLMTTDGVLAHRLISPKWKAEKVYKAECEGSLGEKEVSAFAEGIELKDFTTAPAKLTILSSGETSIAEVALTEGKFHEVKRMFAKTGHPLISLRRLSIGCVRLDEELAEGKWRKLTFEEIDGLKKQSAMDGDN